MFSHVPDKVALLVWFHQANASSIVKTIGTALFCCIYLLLYVRKARVGMVKPGLMAYTECSIQRICGKSTYSVSSPSPSPRVATNTLSP